MSNATNIAAKFLGCMGSLDLQGIDPMLTGDVVCKAPFAPEGLQKEVRGKEAVSRNFAVLPVMFKSIDYTKIEIVKAVDDNLALGFGQADAVLTTGSPYKQNPVFYFKTTPEGKVCEYREYMDSQTQAKVMAELMSRRG